MLVAQDGAIDRDAVAQALGLWPLVVIALGLGILLRRTRLGLPGGMLAAAMPGLLFGGLVVAAPQLAPGCGDVGPVSLATQQGIFGGAAAVDLTLACGDLAVTTAPGSGWLLQAGNASGAVPAVTASADRLSIVSSGLVRRVRAGVRHGRHARRAALWAGDGAAARDDRAALDAAGFHGPAIEADRATVRAGVAAFEGLSIDALHLYREALQAWRDLGLAWDEALCGLDMAILLDPANPEARAAAEAAREILVRLETAPFITRLDAALARRSGRADLPAALSTTASLTPR
jgi:hypothetical protein